MKTERFGTIKPKPIPFVNFVSFCSTILRPRLDMVNHARIISQCAHIGAPPVAPKRCAKAARPPEPCAKEESSLTFEFVIAGKTGQRRPPKSLRAGNSRSWS